MGVLGRLGAVPSRPSYVLFAVWLIPEADTRVGVGVTGVETAFWRAGAVGGTRSK